MNTEGNDHQPTEVTPTPMVTALVTHYNRPHLVGEAIQSLLDQTRRPDAIIVMDDASDSLPLESIPADPIISVYRSTANAGPFRLLNWAMQNIASDWYMIQDSDDISMPTRLERLLDAARTHGADMVGSAIRNVKVATGEVRVTSFPHDATLEHRRDGRPYVCTMGSGVLSRRLWARLGGLATGLRFSGDVEFIARACCTGRVVNIPSIELLRRLFPDSLTQRPDTGMGSPARKALRQQILAAASARVAALGQGLPVDLRPLSTAPEVEMELVRDRHGTIRRGRQS